MALLRSPDSAVMPMTCKRLMGFIFLRTLRGFLWRTGMERRAIKWVESWVY